MTHYLHLLKRLLAGVAFALATQSAYALQVGDKAPDFSLPSSSSGTVSLSDFEGKKSLIVFFYIGAFTKT